MHHKKVNYKNVGVNVSVKGRLGTYIFGARASS